MTRNKKSNEITYKEIFARDIINYIGNKKFGYLPGSYYRTAEGLLLIIASLGKSIKNIFRKKSSDIYGSVTEQDKLLNKLKNKDEISNENKCIKKLWLTKLKQVEFELAVLMDETYKKEIQILEDKDNPKIQKKLKKHIENEFKNIITNAEFLLSQKHKLRLEYCNINCKSEYELIDQLTQLKNNIEDNDNPEIKKINEATDEEIDVILKEYLENGALSRCVKRTD